MQWIQNIWKCEAPLTSKLEVQSVKNGVLLNLIWFNLILT
jgi:hypothetical protein